MLEFQSGCFNTNVLECIELMQACETSDFSSLLSSKISILKLQKLPAAWCRMRACEPQFQYGRESVKLEPAGYKRMDVPGEG